MLRFLLPALGLVALVPGTASAAPFGELPFRAVSGAATCLHATGAPGELVRSLTQRNRGDAGAQLLQASGTGLARVTDLRNEIYGSGCPQAVARPNGAGIVTVYSFSTPSPGTPVIRASLRAPGGAWGPLDNATSAEDLTPGQPIAAAVADGGEALIAFATQPTKSRVEIVAVRRAPGAAFGARERLFSASAPRGGAVVVQAAMSAGGETVVAWTLQPRADSSARELWVSTAAPGAGFRTPVRIAELGSGPNFDLAVGDAGHALLAFATGTDVSVAERAPGGDFGPAAVVGQATDLGGVYPAVAVGPDGAAVVGWLRQLDGAMSAVVRERPGLFSAPRTITRPVRLGISRALLAAFLQPVEDDSVGVLVGLESDDNLLPRATIVSGGRALLTWAAAASRGGIWWTAPQSATIALSGAGVETHVHGPELRGADSITPVVLAGGVPAVAWTTNAESGQVHLAAEGAVDAPAEPAPRVRVEGPAKRVLKGGDSLKLKVTCSAACDVRAQVGDAALKPSALLSLDRAGSGELQLDASLGPIAPLREGALRVRLAYSAPGARTARTRTLALRLHRPPGPPLPRVLAPVARRDGDDVVVSWRTKMAADTDSFFAYATAEPRSLSLRSAAPSGGPRRFKVRLRNVAGARYVTILTGGENSGVIRHLTIQVKG